MQEDIITSILEGKDTLALLPTGGGKSICFQVPAMVNDGICIVISPLISLMKDQVMNLKKRGIQAEAIFSGLKHREIDQLLDNCIYGNTKFLYLSPERLKSDLAIQRISKMDVNLIAIDEAHCISQWGYDFRPPYLEVAEIRKLHPHTPVIALTATATPEVVEDIQERLKFKKGQVFQKSFRRENLAYVVLPEENKEKKLLEILKKVPGTGVVYVRNRKKTKLIANLLIRHGISADFYHAGLESPERSKRQEDWILGKTRVIVATNAFGMGIDKADVRTVVHIDLPDNLEAYFQEAGRGGRDGKKSYATLLYSPTDKEKLNEYFKISYPEFKEIKRVYRALGSYLQLAVGGGSGMSYDFDLVEFSNNFNLNILTTLSSLKHLEKMGWLVLTESVYMPATIEFIVSREEMYAFQIKYKKLDKLLKNLARVYQGIFSHSVPLDPGKLANHMKITLELLETQLRFLQNEGILRYSPKKDKPQLVFTEDRINADDLSLDLKLYKFLKERQKYRIEKAVEYCENPVCRSTQLLEYFGEKEATICGVCDVCLGRTEGGISKDDFDRYRKKLEAILKKEDLTLEEILESFSPKYKDRMLKSLEFLIAENLVEKIGEKYKLLAK